LAAERGSAEDLEKVLVQLQLMDRAEHDLVRFQEADISFHMAIGLAAHNRILSNALLLTRNLLMQWIGSTLRRAGVPAEAIRQHREIYNALERRDGTAARTAMSAHLDAMAAHFRDVIQDPSSPNDGQLIV
ncbi:MAG TPA: FCD domain-containing protein, partial [Bryobacteraceae bacterium]|nr:FCD domain-containing protein [Bryobacteraceae bacterium]